MQPEVICFGELLIDFVASERGVSVGAAPGFHKAPGGAPANVAVGLAKLGIPTGFMGQVGDDFFGHFLAQTLAEQGVNIEGLRFSSQAMTMLAFVAVDEDGERSFVFYRKPSADMLMTPADLALDLLQPPLKIFHFGSITLIQDPLRATTLEALRLAQSAGALISYDPNLREPLWPDLAAARAGLLLGLDYAQVVKLSEEELRFLTDTPDISEGVAQLWRPHTRLITVTRGVDGCMAFTKERSWPMPGFEVQVVDTIGAGDGFVAGLLAGIWRAGPDWEQMDLRPLLRQANAVGALTASRPGGIPALPTDEELKSFLVRA